MEIPKLFEKQVPSMHRGQGMFQLLATAGIGFTVLAIVIFSVVLPIVNTQLYGGGATATNLATTAETQVANQTKLFILLAMIFVPLAALAIAAFAYAGGGHGRR